MSKKRKLSEIKISDSIKQPFAKKQKIEEPEHYGIFDVLNIRDTILDYLSISYENIRLFMHIADDHYFKRRLLHLNKNDVIKIVQHIEESTKEPKQYHLHHLSILYANVKLLFGEHLFKMLLTIPIPILMNIRFDHTFSATPQTEVTHTTRWTNNGLEFLGEIELSLKTAKDITTIFDDKQQSVLKYHGIHLKQIHRVRFKVAESSSHSMNNRNESEFDFKFEILPSNHDAKALSNVNNSRTWYSTFGFELCSKPSITTIPIWKKYDETQQYHTKCLLYSVERVFIMRSIEDGNIRRNDNHTFILHLDHSSNHNLSKIWIIGQHDNDFNVEIKYDKYTSHHAVDDLEILNLEEKCNISSNLFSIYPWNIGEIENQFITSCRIDHRNRSGHYRLILNDDNAKYEESVIIDGLINVMHEGDVYYFKINQDSELRLQGWTATTFAENNYVNINTSDIPRHWIKMEIGGRFCPIKAILNRNRVRNENEYVFVCMDGFSDDMIEFSINERTVIFSGSMNYTDIPNNMKCIRLPYDDYDFIMDQLPFLNDNRLTADDLPYKPIEFKFFEMLYSDSVKIQDSDDDDGDADIDIDSQVQEINEYELEKLINPVFDTAFDRNNIIIYRRDNV